MNYFGQEYKYDNESTTVLRDLVPLILRTYTFYLKAYTFTDTPVAIIDKF